MTISREMSLCTMFSWLLEEHELLEFLLHGDHLFLLNILFFFFF